MENVWRKRMIKLSDYVFSFLASKGVQHVFMLPGGGAMHLVDSLGSSGLNYYPFLHEQGASIAAEAFGQHTNTPGIVLVTSGPGATNAITAVTAGWIDSTPMFIISGQSKRSDLVGDRNVRQIGSQEVQIVDMVKPITKYCIQVLDPEKIKYYLEYAWNEATTGRPGPVWLDIPLDVQGTIIDESRLDGYKPKESDNDISKIKDAVKNTIDLLWKAEKPLFLAGNGIKLAGASDLARKILRRLGIPVETTWKTLDMFGEDEPVYVGHPGIMGDRGANLIVQSADLIISVGCRLDSSVTAFNEPHFGMNAKKVIVDVDPNEIIRMNIEKSVEIACDAGLFLSLLDEIAASIEPRKEWINWRNECHSIRGRYPIITDEHRNQKDYVCAYYFIDELCKYLKPSDVIVPESAGGAGEITYQAFKVKEGQKIKNAAGLGSMGFGLPYSIGSCIANGKRRTILINGDGAFQLNIQELETLHRLQLPVKMFIWNNGGYASIRSMQRNNFDGRYVASEPGSGLTIPKIGSIAAAYGFKTYLVRNNAELDCALPEIMKDDEPLLCEVMVIPEETVSPRVKAFVGENGTMKSGTLENMWPPINAE